MRPAPNRLPIGRGRRIKSALKHVSRTSAPKASSKPGRYASLAARKETSLRSSSTTERARLPHFNEATCGFRSPALVGRIDFGEIELRGKRLDRVPLLADCSFRLLRTKLFSAAKDFVLLVYSLLPSCFALETAKAVPPHQGGGIHQAGLVGGG